MSPVLTEAADVLSGRIETTSDRGQLVCWIVRDALEDAVWSLAQELGVRLGSRRGLGTRAVLRAVAASRVPGDPGYAEARELVAQAEYAYGRLSDACHYYAYELPPTVEEAWELLEVVDAVERRVEEARRRRLAPAARVDRRNAAAR